MNEIINELDALLLQIHKNRQVLDFPSTKTLDELKEICDASSQIVCICEFQQVTFSMVHCNESAFAYLNSTEEEINKLGFKYILKLVHPENVSAVFKLIKFFRDLDNHNKIFSYTFYINSTNGWEWSYASFKPATYNEDGTVKYVIGVGRSINDLIKSRKQSKLLREDLSFFEEHLEKYLSMTEREKEILKLITEEHSSNEIAKKLSISPYTVDTHRKNLLEKLDVKSSIGLAKYALLFNLM